MIVTAVWAYTIRSLAILAVSGALAAFTYWINRRYLNMRVAIPFVCICYLFLVFYTVHR